MFRYRRQMRKFFGVFGDLFLFNSRFDAGKHFYDNAILRQLIFTRARIPKILGDLSLPIRIIPVQNRLSPPWRNGYAASDTTTLSHYPIAAYFGVQLTPCAIESIAS